LPLASDGTTLFVATADPANYAPLDDLAMLFRTPVQPIVVPFDTLARSPKWFTRRAELAMGWARLSISMKNRSRQLLGYFPWNGSNCSAGMRRR